MTDYDVPDYDVPLTGEPLAVELVNTTFVHGGLRGHLVDVLTTPHQLDRWLAGHASEFSVEVRAGLTSTEAAVAHLRMYTELRGALRNLMVAVTTGRRSARADVAVLNATSRAAASWPELRPESSLTVRLRWPTEDWLAIAAGEIAATGTAVLTGTAAEHLRACPAPGCILYFVRSHPRREWCTTTCGNRVRVARYGKRHAKPAGRIHGS